MALLIQQTTENGICFLRLNRPEKLNCISREMLLRLDEAIDTAGRDAAIRVVVLQGAGDRAFSSGADLKEFSALQGPQTGEWIRLGNEVFNRLESLPKPTVAVIRGYALGGGLELALACDFRLAYPDAWFANPEVQRGWLPGWGGMWRLPRLLGEARAKELILLSERIDAQEALRLGLVTRLVSFGEGPETVRAFAGKLGSLRPEIFALAKTSLTGSAGSLRDRAIQFDVLAALYAKNLAG